jgi:hypothetical protein
MTIVGSFVVVAALIALIVAIVVVVRRVVRWAVYSTADPRAARRRVVGPGPYGPLQSLANPVGPLGYPEPNADIGSDLTNPEEIYGE